MADFGPGDIAELGYGITLRSVDVSGRVENSRVGPTQHTPVRDAEPGDPAGILAGGGMPEAAADRLGSAMTSAGMRLQASFAVPELIAPPNRPTARSRSADLPHLEIEVDAPRPGEGQIMAEVDGTGLVRWHLPRPATPGGGAARAGGAQRFVVPVDQFALLGGPPATDPSRSVLGFGVRKVLQVLRFPVERAAGWVAERAVAVWEERYRPYRLSLANADGSNNGEADPARLAQLADAPFLMLVHGAFDLGANAFGQLFSDAVFRDLHQRYGGRVLVFDHPSLHRGPRANAEWLLGRLPDDRRLSVDVVAHSRGGLVGRHLAGLAQPGGSGLDVRRLVHVATPNAGTTLASTQKIGDLLDVFSNLLSLFSAGAGGVALEAVLEVVKQVAVGAIGGLDGLAAMDPDSPELAVLNRNPAPRDGSVRAVTSDYEPGNTGSLAARALDTVVDALFGAANDLVVPTDGVFSAGAYVVPEPFRVGAGGGTPPVTHVGFFRNAAVRGQLAGWLG